MTDSAALVGTWKMISWQREVVATGQRFDALGPEPIGYINYGADGRNINYGADGRMFAFVLSKDRAAPASAVPTMRKSYGCSTACTYTVHPDRVVHHIDASWNQTWTGTDQTRFYNLNGGTLTLSGVPAPDPYTGEQVVHRIAFQSYNAALAPRADEMVE